MTIRVLAEARGDYRKAFLEQMILKSSGKIEVALHFGDKNSDFDIPSLLRQEYKIAQSGRIFDKSIYTGANLPLISSEGFHSAVEQFCDQLHRSSSKYQRRSHKMINLHEYLDYYHILSDAIGQKILERGITHAIFFDVPHLAIDTLIYDLCVSMNIKIIILSQFSQDKIFSMQRIQDLGEASLEVEATTKFPLDTSGRSELDYMDTSWQTKGPRGRMRGVHIWNLICHLMLKSPGALLDRKFIVKTMSRMKGALTLLPEWRDPFGKFFNHDYLDYLEYLAKYEGNLVPFDIPYIYVPLHLQPEMTTSSLGGIYRDQLLMIEHLHQKLPNGWKILVKENPKQGPFARGPMFFHRLNRLNNVIMVPADTDTKRLTRESKLVATVTGTAAFEAIQMRVPAVTFGNAWFNSLPGITRFTADIDLVEISKLDIDLDQLSKSVGALFNVCHNGNIDKWYLRGMTNSDKEKNAKAVGNLLYRLLTEEIPLTFSGPSKR